MILLLLAELAQFGDAVTFTWGWANFDHRMLGESSTLLAIVGPGMTLALKAWLMCALLVLWRKRWIRPVAYAAAGVGAVGMVMNIIVMGGLV